MKHGDFGCSNGCFDGETMVKPIISIIPKICRRLLPTIIRLAE